MERPGLGHFRGHPAILLSGMNAKELKTVLQQMHAHKFSQQHDFHSSQKVTARTLVCIHGWLDPCMVHPDSGTQLSGTQLSPEKEPGSRTGHNMDAP